MAGLPDPLLSRAVLVGVGGYRDLPSLSAVGNNVRSLKDILCADRFWGLQGTHCAVVEDPLTAADMLDPVVAAAADATDTLLLYYAGHGLVDRRSELHLALVGSDPQRIYTAVPYGHVRDALLDSRAARRIVILDCCYSGRALGQMADHVTAVVDEASAEGTYVLTATAENKSALAPEGSRYTAFTGELLEVINKGIPECGPLLDLDSVYRHLLKVMTGKGLPAPQKRDRNTAGQLTLIRNQAFKATRSTDLVIIDGDYLVSALLSRLSINADGPDVQQFSVMFNIIMSELVLLGRVVLYAEDSDSEVGRALLDAARQAGAVVSVVDGSRPQYPKTTLISEKVAEDDVLRSGDLILVSGRKDFAQLAKEVRAAGALTTVLCLPDALDAVLAAAADEYKDLLGSASIVRKFQDAEISPPARRRLFEYTSFSIVDPVESYRRFRKLWSALTPREREIASMTMMSDSEIGYRLRMSPETVARYVDSIIAKLGLNSRPKVSRWVSMQSRHEAEANLFTRLLADKLDQDDD
jgi:DNA-binding CsgD family transcriptional regulator